MFVELIEALRCPRAHEATQLVASASRTEARHIVDGVLGCSVCGAEFPISSGIARFDDPLAATPSELPEAETAMRLAAFLELTDARGFALLCGRWGAHAEPLRQLTDAPVVLVNPPTSITGDAVAGIIVTRDVVPLAESAARAAALDVGPAQALVESAVHAVRPGGRVVGPVALELPAGLTELVRDDRMWVAEKTTASHPTPRLVSIKRASR